MSMFSPALVAVTISPASKTATLVHCRTAQSFGWAASTNLLLLFYPVPRNTFLHWLFNTDFPGLIKYHRCAILRCGSLVCVGYPARVTWELGRGQRCGVGVRGGGRGNWEGAKLVLRFCCILCWLLFCSGSPCSVFVVLMDDIEAMQ